MTYDLNKAFLADTVYQSVDKLKAGTTFQSSDGTNWTAVVAKSDPATGYQGALFKNEATGQYVFASRGTEIFSKDTLNDLGANLQMGLQQIPDQVAVQREFFETAKNAVLADGASPNSIALTGHSLGGALIQALAAENPLNKADTFNAYGAGNLIAASEGRTYNNITNHVMHLDGVIVLPGSQMIGNTLAYGTANSLDHLLSSFMSNLVETGLIGASLAVAQAAVAVEGITAHLMGNFLNPELAASSGTPTTISPSPLGEQLQHAMDTIFQGLANSVLSAEQFLNKLKTSLESLFSSTQAPLTTGSNESLISALQTQFNTAQNTTSPLVLDLDGDGLVETTTLSNSRSSGTHFNLDAKGLSENTGWVGQDDGLLVRDLNNDGQITSGRELFGNHTLLTNGQEAANGFLALQDLDSNADGVINTQDTAFASLRIWKDSNTDGLTNTGELLTLEQAGVASLNVGYSDGFEGDAQGNQHRQLGGYTTTTGTTQKMNDVWFTTEREAVLEQMSLFGSNIKSTACPPAFNRSDNPASLCYRSILKSHLLELC